MIKTKNTEKTVKRPGKQSRKLFFKSEKRYSQTVQSYMKINYTSSLHFIPEIVQVFNNMQSKYYG